jgi:hypothetical protein
MIVTLVGLNILVFSTSFYGDFSNAVVHSSIGMLATAILVIAYSAFRKGQHKKKSDQGILESREN